ncbi:MAG: ubiquitin carboxyl-terminal hydrolase family protein [Candidatus Babeliales bacterium]|jgi:uncharacterized UBP type Zn finger protein
MKLYFKHFVLVIIIISYRSGHSKNKGLEWGDNSCYFDASVQALSTLKDFNANLSQYNPENYPPTSIYLNLINLINGKFTTDNEYLKSDYEIEGGISLRNFHLGFSQELSKEDEPTGQKDASEFILKILSNIEKQIPELRQKFEAQTKQSLQSIGIKGKDLDEAIQAQLNQLHDPFDKLNFFTLNSKECLNCKHLNEQTEPHRILILNFDSKEASDIKDLLKLNFRDSQISDYKCDNCHKNVTCNGTKKIASLPKYLIIHLSRNNVKKDATGSIIFDASGDPTYELISTPIFFAFEINLNNIKNILSNDIKKELTQKPLKYSLNAVIVHGGESVNSGHYWAYAKSNDPKDLGSWYLYNDQYISDAGKDKDLKPNSMIIKVMQTGLDNNVTGYPNATPYVLFYELAEVGKDEPNFDISWHTAMQNQLPQKLTQLKTSLQELKAKLQILQEKLGALRKKLG